MNDYKKHIAIIGGALTNIGDKQALNSLLAVQREVDQMVNMIKVLEAINYALEKDK